MNVEEYNKQNDELLSNYMHRTFFKAWENADNLEFNKNNEMFAGNYRQLEFNINPFCDLSCKYCYVKKFGADYFPEGTTDKKKILENVDLILDWLTENRYRPTIEIFSGDPLVQVAGHEIINKILTRAEQTGYKITDFISVPTNMGFLLHPKREESVRKLIDRGKKLDINIGLSASVDGPFMEENRPFENPKHKRTPEFYDKLFSFAKEHHIGFHPMIYSNNIEKWKDNFLWFQDKFKEYDLRWSGIYLLEVRNQEWSVEQAQHLADFMTWLVKWTWDKCGHDLNVFGYGGYFNILSSPLSQTGRGIGCSIQSSLQVRLGDLTWGLCHRLMYDKFNNGYFEVKDGKITGVKSKNVESYLGMASAVNRNFPGCEACTIKSMCSSGCLGSNYESTGDLFSTHPSVCRMEHYKVKGILEGYKQIGLLGYITSVVNDDKKFAIKSIMEI